MRFEKIKKTSQDDQQYQTTTTNFKFNRPFVRFKKRSFKNKFNNKVKIASDKTEIKQNNW